MQMQLFWCANLLIEQFMARRTENPDHVRATILHFSPGSVPLELWTMGDFKHPTFAAGLAFSWKIGMPSEKPSQGPVFVRTAGIINFLFAWVFIMECLALFLSGGCGAFFRTVPPIAVRMLWSKMDSTFSAVSSFFENARLLTMESPKKRVAAFLGTIELVRPFCSMFTVASITK